MDPIFLWWLTLGALIGFGVAWIWDWLWFRARKRVVSVDVDTQLSTLTGERDRLAADLKTSGDRRVALEGDLKACGDRRVALEGELKACGDRRVALEGDLAAARGDLDGLRLRIGELEAANAQLTADLEAARGAAVLGAAATLGVAADHSLSARAIGDEGDNEIVASLREYNLAMHDELDATRRTLARFAAGKGDPLIDIDGIGPVYQNKLYDAGVVSFDQVAAMHPDRLRSVVAPNAVFELDTGSWIEQARKFSGRPLRDPLIDINGIGPVYEQRLLNAGVTSFAQLADMAPSEIRAIIRPEAWQNVEVDAWITEARTLAEQVRAGTYRKGEY